MGTTRRTLLVVVTVLFLIAGNAAAAGFVKFDGVDGESNDESHKKWIDVLSIDWGMESVQGLRGGSSRGSNRPSFGDLTVAKRMDSATPIMIRYFALGDRFREVLIDIPLDRDGERMIRLMLLNVRVTGVHMSQTAGEDVPTENVTLNFTEFKVIHEGPPGDPVSFGWDIRGGEEL